MLRGGHSGSLIGSIRVIFSEELNNRSPAEGEAPTARAKREVRAITFSHCINGDHCKVPTDAALAPELDAAAEVDAHPLKSHEVSSAHEHTAVPDGLADQLGSPWQSDMLADQQAHLTAPA